MPLTDWARELHMKPDTIRHRLDREGMSVSQALTTPSRTRGKPRDACTGCRYWVKMARWNTWRYCGYLEIEGHRRPADSPPAGPGRRCGSYRED